MNIHIEIKAGTENIFTKKTGFVGLIYCFMQDFFSFFISPAKEYIRFLSLYCES